MTDEQQREEVRLLIDYLQTLADVSKSGVRVHAEIQATTKLIQAKLN
ncbi:hypothetical protein HNR44_001553 [Geomicrobium halophilum]|uniref:Uncharacterized protein n=1 Tax=Geomicrobium halophilum TaxID=549000 RepID=A0A841PP73_9BACL|nr:hypothetical protein [Geomicrobium halophilum]MBB6449604.1 hypothetical protein [Geomicrobium halophilum]